MHTNGVDTNDEQTLDPQNWEAMRALGHQMIDDVMDFLQEVRQRPVWKKIPLATKEFLQQDVPNTPQPAEEIYQEFRQHILPYAKGSIHPRFWAWVEGTGTPLGVLADLLASGMNSNVAIGEHSAMYVDRQVIDWCKQIMQYPVGASGMLVSGGSMANVTALITARNYKASVVRQQGVATAGNMAMYCSAETHACVVKAAEVMGIGAEGVRKIAVDDNYQMDTQLLRKAIDKDLADGCLPFCIVGNAGTVNTGAIDDLTTLRAICDEYNLWLHIDGAFGAFAKLVPGYEEKLQAVEVADSLAIDLHKWMYMPYEVGCALIKNAEAHRNAFASSPNYLLAHERGLAAGPDSFQNYGIELSRGFKALKVWMSIKEHGLDKYKALIKQNIEQAFYAGELVKQHPQLELLTPVTMNIVCYRFTTALLNNQQLNNLNKEIVMRLQEEGIASPSSTMLNGRYAIRVAIVNHRSRREDLDMLITETVRIGNLLMQQAFV